MRITNKNKYKKKYFSNLSAILNDKPDYLKNLEKKRIDGLKKIKEEKARLIIDDTLKINKFKRNYSCFSHNSMIDKSIKPLTIDIFQILKKPIKYRIIENYSNKKVITKQVDNILFSNEYIQKKNLEIKHSNNFNNINNKNKRYKLLMNIGKQVMKKNIINDENGKNYNYRNIDIQI